MNELEIIQHGQIQGLSIFFNTVDYRTPHIHPEWELVWNVDQPLSITCSQQQFVVEAGRMVLFSPNEPHEFHKAKKSCTFLCLQISPEILPAMPQLILDAHLPHEYLSAEDLGKLKCRLVKVTSAYFHQKENFALYCRGHSLLILHQLLERLPSHVLTRDEALLMDQRNARLKRLIQFVDERYMDKIRLSDFAEAENCSMSYLSHFIKATMNQTFQEYVTSVRFNCACKLIAAGEKRMLDVCMESGFSDYRYFSKEFQKQYGMTPHEYSRQLENAQRKNSAVCHSLHSVERFYSREESLILLNTIERQ